MIPSLDLVLETLERALTVAVAPATATASAKEDASLGILVCRWVRDVVDHAVECDLSSARDVRAALADVARMLSSGDTGPAVTDARVVVHSALAAPPAADLRSIREEANRHKTLLARTLRAARADGDGLRAHAIRRRLAELAAREIERERSFTRATGIDADAGQLATLACVLEGKETP